MLKKLKLRFILATVISLVLVIGLIIGVINLLNYNSVVKSADRTTEMIMNNGGHFPMGKHDMVKPEGSPYFTPEAPYESRYFTVNLKGTAVDSVNTWHIAAVDDEEATDMAVRALKYPRDRGFIGNYRFLIKNEGNITKVIFLDCTRSLESFRSFAFFSIVISLAGILAVSLLLFFISERIVRPINESYEKQRRFITDAGHDLKTPITIIDADAELLEMEVGDSEWLSDIRKQTSRLATLTGELVYLSRMEEIGSVNHIDFSISDACEDVLSSFAAPARAKGLEINQQISPALSYCGDESAIRKLLTLLLDNAVKYSPSGEKINVTLRRQGKNLVLHISNKAPDLSDEAVKHMFERFYRSDVARSSNGGFGIGLSVAQAIVASHKGKISATKETDALCIEVIL